MTQTWQNVIDLLAEVACVPSSLLMRTQVPDHSVLVSSRGAGNPYKVGQSFELNDRLYCHAVLQNREQLTVRNAHDDPLWCDNQDLDHGMSFYIGYPVSWPDGEIFGTICVLDCKDNETALSHRKLLEELRKVIERDLNLLCETSERRRLERELQATLNELEDRISRRTKDLEEANTALKVLLDNLEQSRAATQDEVRVQINKLVAPHIASLRHTASEPARQTYLDLLETGLRAIASPAGKSLNDVLALLTNREAEIAQLVMAGHSTKDIAHSLSREASTIDFHRNNIRQKLGLGGKSTSLRKHLLSLV